MHTAAVFSRLKLAIVCLISTLFTASAFAGNVNITSPQPSASVTGTVTVAASANEPGNFHMEVWDNGSKIGDFFSTAIATNLMLRQGAHFTTVLAVNNRGIILDASTVFYLVVAGNSGSGGVSISSPGANTTSISAVTIAASASSSAAAQLQIWDNGVTLGVVPANSVNGVYVLPNGPHQMSIQALDNNNNVIDTSTVNFTVAENCSNSRYAQCDLDQLPIDNSQNVCDPRAELAWIANPCGSGVQGVNPTNPLSTWMGPIYEGGNLLDQWNFTLNGQSLHLTEIQGANPSNVLFRGQSPTPTPNGAVDSNWTLDEYVYLPDPTAHQAFEMDAQYSANGVWTKFYTECAFNLNNGTGYWAVFDTNTGGWIFLNGQWQGGQLPPAVPCNRSQFQQPWPGSTNPGFTGWHHIAWTFVRNNDGTVFYQSLVFDGTTTQVNFQPNSGTGGQVSDNGNFSALIQLNGITNNNRQHNFVDAYVSEVNLFHNP